MVEPLQSPRGDGIRRSIDLVKAFRLEQDQPDVFYSKLAADTLRMISAHIELAGSTVVDVGAGRPQFSDAFLAAGSRYVGIDPDVTLLQQTRGGGALAVAGSGLDLPLADGVADIVVCSNVFEHVPDHRTLGSELARVVRPGGFLFVSYTNWLSPWGGHDLSPYHWFGAQRATRRYERKYGRACKHIVDENLFRVSVRDGLTWAKSLEGFTVQDARPRYYPNWVSWLVRVPGIREVASWNLWMAIQRDSADSM